MNPTQEQLEIFEKFKHNKILKINAVAGSGKSTTLRMLAELNQVPSLYLCFNKSNAEEAKEKFPSHVDCRTIHSLAYSVYGKMLSHKLKRPAGKYKNVAGTASEISLYYKVCSFYTNDGEIPPNVISTFAKAVVRHYENCSDEQITKYLLPTRDIDIITKNHPSLDKKAFGKAILHLAKKLWSDQTNPSSDVLCNPNTYLKLYQLSKPVLNYDIIYLDEAQDSNSTTLDIIKRQSDCKVVYVGDTFQSIYQWRGAVNAMQEIVAPCSILSKSFRYGKAIADIASWVIDDAISVKGSDDIDSKVITSQDELPSNKYTMIFRTNAELLSKAVNLISKGKNVFISVDVKNFIKKLESAENLYNARLKEVKHEDITMFSCWSDLVVAAEDDPELKRVSRIIDSRQTFKFINALGDVQKVSSSADIILTTAHKSKGMEWDHVVLANDFKMDSVIESTNQEEVNLFYVACTRAIKVLQLPSSLDAIFTEEK